MQHDIASKIERKLCYIFSRDILICELLTFSYTFLETQKKYINTLIFFFFAIGYAVRFSWYLDMHQLYCCY